MYLSKVAVLQVRTTDMIGVQILVFKFCGETGFIVCSFRYLVKSMPVNEKSEPVLYKLQQAFADLETSQVSYGAIIFYR